MADLSIQFHALPEELLSFVRESIDEFHLHVVGISFPPWRVTLLNPRDVNSVFSGGNVRMLAFGQNELDLFGKSQGDFAERNPGLLYLRLGRHTSNGLAESGLVCRTRLGSVPTEWKKIASKLRKFTTAGAIAFDPESGAESLSRAHRFTEGARRLSEQGVPMLPLAGATRFKFLRRKD